MSRWLPWVGAVLAIPIAVVFLVIVVVSSSQQSCGNRGHGTGSGPGVGKLKVHGIPARYVADVRKAGRRCEAFPAPVIAAQIGQESGWSRHATSPTGAEGIAQFEPSAWSTWGHGSADDPSAAISAQARYDCSLAKQMQRAKAAGRVHGGTTQLALAAYNAGTGAVMSAGGIPPIPQTQQYVPAIMHSARTTYSKAGSGSGSAAGGGVQLTGCRVSAGGVGAPASGAAKVVVQAAERWRGTPYSWGGGTPAGQRGGSVLAQVSGVSTAVGWCSTPTRAWACISRTAREVSTSKPRPTGSRGAINRPSTALGISSSMAPAFPRFTTWRSASATGS